MKLNQLTPEFKKQLNEIYSLFDRFVVIDKDKAFAVLLAATNKEARRKTLLINPNLSWRKVFDFSSRKSLANGLLDDYLKQRSINAGSSGSIKSSGIKSD